MSVALSFVENTFQPFWFALANVEKEFKAPYSSDARVTLQSKYGDMEWVFPEDWLTPGHRYRNTIRFSNWSTIGNAEQLFSGTDDILIEQLKQFTYCLIFHRGKLLGRRKVINARPRTIDAEFALMRQFFVAMKKCSVSSLEEITQKNISHIFSSMEITPKRFNLLIEYIDCVIVFSKLGLIENGPVKQQLTFKKKVIVEDSSRRRGVQPLDPDQIAQVISTSMFYMDNADELYKMVCLFRASPPSDQKPLIDVFALKYKIFDKTRPSAFENKVWKLIQISGFHLTGFHLGMRISEFLSQKVGCVGVHKGVNVMFNDRVTLCTTTIKSAESLYGTKRYFPIHPYIAYVYEVIFRFKELFNVTCDLLFTTLTEKTMWNTSNFNAQLCLFNEAHGFDFKLSTHVWRKTIVATTTLSVRNSLDALRELLGHKAVAEAAAYAMSSPFVKAELDREHSKLVTSYLEEMIGDSLVFGGRGLGGPQGLQFEASLRASGVDKFSKRRQRQELDKIVRQSIALNIKQLPVGEHIDCFKQNERKGACAQFSGDNLPDVANCRPDCRYRIERISNREALLLRIESAPNWLLNEDISLMERVRQALDVVENLAGWPDLRPSFESMLQKNPNLMRFFGQ